MKLRNLSPLFIASILLVMGGCDSDKNIKKEVKEERAAPVKVITMKKGDVVSYISATGTLVPIRQARIGPKVEGKIEKIYADEGDFIKEGAPLIKLDQKTYSIAKDEAEATLNTARAKFTKSEIDLENLEKDYKRLSTLYEKKAIAEQGYDAISARYKTAQTELKLAAAQVREAEEKLNMTVQNLKDTLVCAPFAGFVVEKLMEEGEVSNFITYQWNVFVLVDIGNVKVECPISENEIRFIHLGKGVEINVDAFPGKTFLGKITNINPKVDEKSRTFLIKIEIPNKDYRLKGGMFARVRIPKQKKESILYIPKDALLVKGNENIVFMVEDGLAKARRLTLGISDGNLIEVTDGLKENEIIIIEGFHALKDGTKVEVIK